MKLLLTLDFPPETGGVQRYLFDRVAHTYAPGDRVAVGCGRRDAGAEVIGLPCTITRHSNLFSGMNKKWSIVNLLAFLVTGGRGDCVVECGNLYAALAPWALSFFRRATYHVYTYGGELLCLRRRGPGRWLFRSVLRRASTVSALGGFGAELLRQAGVAGTIRIDPPRITLPGACPPLKRLPVGSRPLQLLSVGRLVPHKGHAVLLKAAALLPRDLDWRLVIAGDGPEENRLAAIIAKNKLASRVSLKKGMDDSALEGEYGSADIFILPSIETEGNTEGFGIVLLEAAARGVPIIASRIGGIPEVLDDGRCGMLVNPDDPSALCEAIRLLAGDEENRKQLTARAFARVRERYAW